MHQMPRVSRPLSRIQKQVLELLKSASNFVAQNPLVQALPFKWMSDLSDAPDVMRIMGADDALPLTFIVN
jgi:hypothetical protein